jgi:NAD-dependent oxidoreductase involved in siderophore biosynthesis
MYFFERRRWEVVRKKEPDYKSSTSKHLFSVMDFLCEDMHSKVSFSCARGSHRLHTLLELPEDIFTYLQFLAFI